MAQLPERITTERLLLRLWELTDVAVMTEAITTSIEHLRPWMPWIAGEPMADAERAELMLAWRERWAAGAEAHYGVFAGDTLVGSGGLMSRVGAGGLDIGYWIHTDHVRQGYATELAAGLTEAALAAPGVHRVEIHHDVANVASAGVPRALGYWRKPDHYRQPLAPAETGTDWVWVINREEWEARREAGRTQRI